MATFTPTQEQQDVLNILASYFEDKLGPNGYHTILSIFLSAVAGSGKTSTIMLIAELIDRIEKEHGIRVDWCSLSFNKPIMLQSNKKYAEAGLRQVAKTTNSLGRSILVSASEVGQCRAPKAKANTFKYKSIIEKHCKTHARQIPNVNRNDPLYLTEEKLVGKIKQLVSAARSTYCDPSNEEAFLDLVGHYPDIKLSPTSPYWSFIWQAVAPVIRTGIELYKATGDHDFDDQLYLPLALDVAAPIYDFIAIDEAQDLNKVRTELVKRAVRPDGTLFFVGDRRQAIQGFAFADTDSVDNIIAETNAVELPLTCCWRCDANIIRLAQVINPAIQARPDAPNGIVEVVKEDEYIKQLKSGYWSPDKEKRVEADMVICRVTADLVSHCLAAIRAGVLAVVRGKDIGKSVTAVLTEILENDPEAYDLHNLGDCIENYHTVHALALMNCKDAEEELDKLDDKVDTLKALIDGYWMSQPKKPSIADLKAFIDSKFADESANEGEEGSRPVIFSTIHKAKGLEAPVVYILRGDLMPHPMSLKSGKDWQIEQEYNVLYVAVTRAKSCLRFVGYVPDSLRGMYQLIRDQQEATTEAERQVAEVSATILALPDDDDDDTETEEVVPAAALEAPKTKKKTGRKAKAKEDQTVRIEYRTDPSVRSAFENFVESMAASDDWKEIIPIPNGKNSGKNKLAASDVITAALLQFAPFAAYFQTSPEYQQYAARLAREEQAREDYRHRNRRKKTVEIAPISQPELEPELEDNNDPDPDDDPHGGQMVPALADSDDWQTPDDADYCVPGFDPFDHQDHNELATLSEESVEASALFEDLEDAAPIRNIQRIFYHCPRPSCKRHWYVDYYKLPNGRLYRLENGKTIYAEQDFPQCPYCGNDRKWLKKTFFKGSFSSKRKCDSRCWNALPGSPCSCQCGGVNHATGHDINHNHGGNKYKVEQIGQNLLQSADITGD